MRGRPRQFDNKPDQLDLLLNRLDAEIIEYQADLDAYERSKAMLAEVGITDADRERIDAFVAKHTKPAKKRTGKIRDLQQKREGQS